MPRTTGNISLFVSANGWEIGKLTKSTNGSLAFQYAPTWLDTLGARPISLSLPLRMTAYRGDLVYNFFDNLLPDSQHVRTHIQQFFQTATSHTFDLLAAIGGDCVGALQLTKSEPEKHQIIRATALSDTQIEQMLEAVRLQPLGMQGLDDEFRISIAGAQSKTALLWHAGQWQRPHGPTPTTHIFKLPIGHLDRHALDLSASCENEWLCLTIARAFGLPAATAQILTFGAQKALVVQRFDRQWDDKAQWIYRKPQEDCCQAFGIAPTMKYEEDGGPGIAQIMKTLAGSTNAALDRANFLRAQVLFWLLAAPDGHAKNFSLFIQPEGRYALTPLYDILSAYPMISPKFPAQRIKMAMAVKGKNRHYRWQEILPRHFISTASLAGYPAEEATNLVHAMLAQADAVAAQVSGQLPRDFPPSIAEPIFSGMRDRARIGLNSLAHTDAGPSAP